MLTATLFFTVVTSVLLLYFPVLGFGYVWDDRALFLDSPALRSISTMAEWWVGVSKPILPATTYFRPAVLSTFVLEFWGNKTNPALSHAVNLFIFALNVCLVGVLAYLTSLGFSTYRRSLAIAIAMGVYGFHPANIESTAWVAGRFDLMVTFFGLTLLIVDRVMTGTSRWIAIGVCYFFAAASKEMAIVIPLAYTVFRVFFSMHARQGCKPKELMRGIFRDKLFWSGAFAILASGALYLVLRIYAMHKVAHVDQYLNQRLGFFEHIIFVFRAIWFYIQTAAFPFFGVSVQHPLAPDDFSGVDVLLALLAAAAIIGVLVACIKCWRNFEFWLFLLSILCLIPVVHIIPLTIGGNIGHERFLALPLCFFALAVGRSTSAWIEMPSIFRGGVVIGLALWMLLAITNVSATLPAWRDEVTLWSWAYKQHPDTPYVQASLVTALFKNGQYREAEFVANQALAIRPETPPMDVLIVSAQIDLANNRNDVAVHKMLQVARLLESSEWQKKYEKDGGDKDRLKGIRRHLDGLLSGAYLALGDIDDGLFYAKRAANQLPQSPNADLNLARAEYFAGNWLEGQQAFARAVKGVSEVDKVDILRTRYEFIAGLCRNPNSRYEKLCEQWRNEAMSTVGS